MSQTNTNKANKNDDIADTDGITDSAIDGTADGFTDGITQGFVVGTNDGICDDILDIVNSWLIWQVALLVSIIK